jgi:hypothetical protein
LAFLAALFGLLVIQRPKQTLFAFLPAACVPIIVLLAVNYISMGDIVPAYSKFGSEWYEYEGSHWQKPPPGQVKHGIDWAWMHESRATYAFHVLVGHHGLLSLSPIWALAVAGMVCGLVWLLPGRARAAPSASWLSLAVMTFGLSIVVIGFYLLGTDRATNNYGGNTSGLRWLMWLWPLWLLTMLPVADWMSERRWARWLGYALLAWSVFSVNYPPWNPWRQPWLYNLLESGGYVAY